MPKVELPQAEFKVVILGDTCSGKTSLVLRFTEGSYITRSSTCGAFFITKRIQTSNGITCKVQIWDTAGQAQFRALAPMYYKTAAAAVVCYDVTSEHSFQIMRDWVDELHQNVPAGSIVLAIAATKCDLLEESDNERGSNKSPAVPIEEAEKMAQALGAIHITTSAKSSDGVEDLFREVVERVLRFRRHYKNVSIPVTPGATPTERNQFANDDENDVEPPFFRSSARSLFESSEQESRSNSEKVRSNTSSNGQHLHRSNANADTSASNLNGKGGVGESALSPRPLNDEYGSLRSIHGGKQNVDSKINNVRQEQNISMCGVMPVGFCGAFNVGENDKVQNCDQENKAPFAGCIIA
uniref:Uncharacterized protein n=1 Tax=Leptocylindrus danicus TaxID=163516 RepID=A0A7S2PD07_9STRA|mmetsp:Transcript_29171/g.42809  ORF Transcript_29171/g.42809 Transcript_29171/m.42809 type:complete len:354 (+) Transcript_29171:130-1191(+)